MILVFVILLIHLNVRIHVILYFWLIINNVFYTNIEYKYHSSAVIGLYIQCDIYILIIYNHHLFRNVKIFNYLAIHLKVLYILLVIMKPDI